MWQVVPLYLWCNDWSLFSSQLVKISSLPLHASIHITSELLFSKQSPNSDSEGVCGLSQQLVMPCQHLGVWFKPPCHIKGLTVSPSRHLANTLGLQSNESLDVCKSGCAFLPRQLINVCVGVCVNSYTLANICISGQLSYAQLAQWLMACVLCVW